MSLASKLKKSARDRSYYRRHRKRILERKRATYAADPGRFIAASRAYKNCNVSPVAT